MTVEVMAMQAISRGKEWDNRRQSAQALDAICCCVLPSLK